MSFQHGHFTKPSMSGQQKSPLSLSLLYTQTHVRAMRL
jgi:hypothetical protein